jgi:peroxiredoxin
MPLHGEGRTLTERALKAGDQMPSFHLRDAFGKMVSSARLLKLGPLVLTFYRGGWCPYCNADLQALETAYAEIQSMRASLVAVSQQTPQHSKIAQRDNAITFPMLSDKVGELAHSFGIRTNLPPHLLDVLKELEIDLAKVNGEASGTLPMPARYIIGQDSVIAYAEIDSDYTHRPEPGELIPTLKRLAALRSP